MGNERADRPHNAERTTIERRNEGCERTSIEKPAKDSGVNEYSTLYNGGNSRSIPKASSSTIKKMSSANTASANNNKQGTSVTQQDTDFLRVIVGILGIAGVCILVCALLLMGKISVQKIKKEIGEENYLEVVDIYNNEIYGHESREIDAASEIKAAISEIKDMFLDGQYTYEDASSYLADLESINNTEVSNMAMAVSDEIELIKISTEAYENGLQYMENEDHFNAARFFLMVSEESDFYNAAQMNISLCIDSIITEQANVQSMEEYETSISFLDTMLELCPDNMDLQTCRDSLQVGYEGLVRNTAVINADKLLSDFDYVGAFALIEEAIGRIPGDEELVMKKKEYQDSFVSYVRGNVDASVANGDYEAALFAIIEAQGVYDCNEFTELFSEVQKKQEEFTAASATYTAPNVEFITYSGSIVGKEEVDQYSLTAAQSGYYRFSLSDMLSGFKVNIFVYASDGSSIGGGYGLKSENGVTCWLTAGESYSVKVGSYSKTGEYTLTIGQQKNKRDITSHEVIYDSIEYKDQQNVYSFTPEISGVYRFDFADVRNGVKMNVFVYDSLEYSVGGEYGLTNKSGVTVILNAGETYEIKVTQYSNTGNYTLKIGKQVPIVDLSGKNSVNGAITYKDQQNVYTYIPDTSGIYRFTLRNMVNDFKVQMNIYDSLEYMLDGEYGLRSGNSILAELEAGQIYKINVIQNRSYGDYTIDISRE